MQKMADQQLSELCLFNHEPLRSQIMKNVYNFAISHCIGYNEKQRLSEAFMELTLIFDYQLHNLSDVRESKKTVVKMCENSMPSGPSSFDAKVTRLLW